MQLPPTCFAHTRLDSPQSEVGQWTRQTQPAPTEPHGSPVVWHGGNVVDVVVEVVVDVDDVLLVVVVVVVLVVVELDDDVLEVLVVVSVVLVDVVELVVLLDVEVVVEGGAHEQCAGRSLHAP